MSIRKWAQNPMIRPVYCRAEAYAGFLRALADVDSTEGLCRAACAIAQHEHPHADIAATEATLEELAKQVRRRVRSGDPTALLAHLHDVLFELVAFRGNERDYYSPANSYLPEVVRTRRGIPITLVLVYKCVADQLGLNVLGINAPGHFLAGVESVDTHQGRLLYVDPFYGGGVLSRREAIARISMATGAPAEDSPKILQPASHCDWLRRMLNNLQGIFAHIGRERDVLAMQELQDAITARSAQS